MKKLAIITTHPIQYNAPWFKLLSERNKINVKVFYTWSQSVNKKFDTGFQKTIEWDIPLLEGYPYEFVPNISPNPGSDRFWGINNPSLIQSISNFNPDAILVIGWNFKSHLETLLYFHGKKIILFRGDSTLLNEKNGIKKIIRRLWLYYVYHLVDKALFAGVQNYNYFIRHGLKKQQLIFSPHAIDNDRFQNNSIFYEKQSKKLREDLGILNSDFVVLFAGKFDKNKNPRFIISLSKIIPNKNIKFLFVGNGQIEAQLKKEASKDERILFLDFQNQNSMPIIYRIANLFILPSFSETWGLSLNEAMACGIPVAASNKCGAAYDLIKPNLNNSLMFDIDDIFAVREFIMYLMSPENFRKASNSVVTVIQNYRFENIADSIESCLGLS